MIIFDLSQIVGRRYPAGCLTQNLAGGVAPIEAAYFCKGNVTRDAEGRQVPWHN